MNESYAKVKITNSEGNVTEQDKELFDLMQRQKSFLEEQKEWYETQEQSYREKIQKKRKSIQDELERIIDQAKAIQGYAYGLVVALESFSKNLNRSYDENE